MATAQQRAALLAVSCPWCGAAPQAECTAAGTQGRRPVTSLDGGSHDARWRKALDMHARVVRAVVMERTGRGSDDDGPGVDREPVPVGAVDRPW